MQFIMGNLLFSSRGIPSKTKKFTQICGVTLIICGVILIAISQAQSSSWTGYTYYMFEEEARMLLSTLAVLIIVGGAISLISLQFSAANKAELFLYDNVVVGAQPHPYQKFSISYQDIRSVEQISVLQVDMIVLKTEITTYTIPVENLSLAHQLLCEKVTKAKK